MLCWQVIHGSLHIVALTIVSLPYVSCLPMYALVILYTMYTPMHPLYPSIP